MVSKAEILKRVDTLEKIVAKQGDDLKNKSADGHMHGSVTIGEVDASSWQMPSLRPEPRDLFLNDLWEDTEFFARGTGHLETRESRVKSLFKPTGAIGWGETVDEARRTAF